MGYLCQGIVFPFHLEGSEKFSNLFVLSSRETKYPRWPKRKNFFLSELYDETLGLEEGLEDSNQAVGDAAVECATLSAQVRQLWLEREGLEEEVAANPSR